MAELRSRHMLLTRRQGRARVDAVVAAGRDRRIEQY